MPPDNEVNTENMTPIEAKQIKGLNLRNLWGLVGSTVIITATVMSTKSDISSGFKDVNAQLASATLEIKTLKDKFVEKEKEDRERDNKLQATQAQVNTIDLRLSFLERQMNYSHNKSIKNERVPVPFIGNDRPALFLRAAGVCHDWRYYQPFGSFEQQDSGKQGQSKEI